MFDADVIGSDDIVSSVGLLFLRAIVAGNALLEDFDRSLRHEDAMDFTDEEAFVAASWSSAAGEFFIAATLPVSPTSPPSFLVKFCLTVSMIESKD